MNRKEETLFELCARVLATTLWRERELKVIGKAWTKEQVSSSWKRIVSMEGGGGGGERRREILLAFTRGIENEDQFVKCLDLGAQKGSKGNPVLTAEGMEIVGMMGRSVVNISMRGSVVTCGEDIIARELRNLRRLAILDISGTQGGEAVVRGVAEAAEQLEVLRCSGVKELCDSDARKLSGMVSLREIDVSRTKVSDVSLIAWSGGAVAGSLVTVSVSSTQVVLSPQCIESVSTSFTAVRRIDFRGCRATLQSVETLRTKISQRQKGIATSTKRSTMASLVVEIPRERPEAMMIELPSQEQEEASWSVSHIRRLVFQAAAEGNRKWKPAPIISFENSPNSSWKKSKPSSSATSTTTAKPSPTKERTSSTESPRKSTPTKKASSTGTPKRKRPSIVFVTTPVSQESTRSHKQKKKRVEEGDEFDFPFTSKTGHESPPVKRRLDFLDDGDDDDGGH